jgi:hypothetical protein
MPMINLLLLFDAGWAAKLRRELIDPKIAEHR